jgi:hypothetical protein
MVIIPWGVELDDDEVVHSNSFKKVRVVQGEHEHLQFQILGTDLCQRRCEETHNEHHEANQNPRRYSRNSISVFVVFWFSMCVSLRNFYTV